MDFFYSLTQSLSTQLPVLFNCPKYIGLSPQLFLYRMHKISMMPTVVTSTIPPTACTLFRFQQFPAVSSKLLSLYLLGFPQSGFYALSDFSNLNMFSWQPWTLLPKLCKCFLHWAVIFHSSPIPSHLQSLHQQTLRIQIQPLLHQLHAIPIICS